VQDSARGDAKADDADRFHAEIVNELMGVQPRSAPGVRILRATGSPDTP
jgi:hypothetical protein